MPERRRLTVAKIIAVVALGAPSILATIREAFPAPRGGHRLIAALHAEFLDWFFLVVGVLTVVGLIARGVEEHLGGEDLKARARGMLDDALAAHFPDVIDIERHHNRATLFKANWRRTKLKPYARSGPQYQSGIQSFSIDNNKEDNNEGVAGAAWFKNGTVLVRGLPEVPGAWSDTSTACRRYSEKGLLPLAKAARLSVKSRCLLATPVNDFNNQRWGVLVIDSRLPEALDQHHQKVITSFAAAIGKMF